MAARRRWLNAGLRTQRATAWGPVGVLVVLCIALTAASSSFLTAGNLETILDQAVVGELVVIGLTFVVIQGSIDLSVEGVMALCAVVLSLTVSNNITGLDLGPLAIVLVLVLGSVFGALNGFLCTWLRLPSLMITLGTWSVGLGLATMLYPSNQPRITDDVFRQLALGDWFGLTPAVFVTLFCVLLALFLQRYTRFGRYSYAIGGDEGITRLSGVPVRRYKIMAFTFAGLMFALAAVMFTARSGYGNADAGSGELFTSVTAVVVGGTQLTGGRGGILQSTVGVLVLGVLGNGMVLLGIDSFLQEVVQGALTVIVVAASTWFLRSRMRVVK